MRARFMIVAAIALAASMAPLSASASGMSITTTVPASLQLSAKIMVTVPVTVVCTDDPALTPIEDRIVVTIEQAHVSTVSHGTGELDGGLGEFPLVMTTCDGATSNTVSVQVLADTNSAPFKNGSAVVTAFVSRLDGIDCGNGCVTNAESASVRVGPATVKLHS